MPRGVYADGRRGRLRSDLICDVADILELEPSMTLAGMALRLRITQDALTLALRRSAFEGDQRAIAIRKRFNELRKAI